MIDDHWARGRRAEPSGWINGGHVLLISDLKLLRLDIRQPGGRNETRRTELNVGPVTRNARGSTLAESRRIRHEHDVAGRLPKKAKDRGQPIEPRALTRCTPHRRRLRHLEVSRLAHDHQRRVQAGDLRFGVRSPYAALPVGRPMPKPGCDLDLRRRASVLRQNDKPPVLLTTDLVKCGKPSRGMRIPEQDDRCVRLRVSEHTASALDAIARDVAPVPRDDRRCPPGDRERAD